MRARLHVIRNGGFNIVLFVFDEGGELVAIIKHVLVVVEELSNLSPGSVVDSAHCP
jgi:hypothetical protein